MLSNIGRDKRSKFDTVHKSQQGKHPDESILKIKTEKQLTGVLQKKSTPGKPRKQIKSTVDLEPLRMDGSLWKPIPKTLRLLKN